MMDEKDQHVVPAGVATTGLTQDGVPRGVLPNPAWPQQAMVLQPPPTQPLPKKPWVPKIWIIFAVIGLLLLLAPSVMTFLINLEPGDHSDNGDGSYWLPGLLLIPCMLFGMPAVFLAYCVGIAEWVMWVQAARRQHAESARMYVVPPVIMVIGYILVRLSMFAIGSLDI